MAENAALNQLNVF